MYLRVINFWFDEISPEQWFKGNDSLDREIKNRFEDLINQARRCELYDWRSCALGRLAEIILLDQFSRNVFRGHPKAFSADPQALVLAQEAVRTGSDKEIEQPKRSFIYMPYMHSESRLIHEQALQLFNQPGMENNLRAEVAHKAIIDRFGRYPHRNDILGRQSTEEELAFLEEPDSSF